MAGLAYGLFQYLPIPSFEARICLAAVFALLGIAAVVGRVGGRRLPLVAADLLKYRLGARKFQGPVSELVRAEAPPQPAPKPNPLLILAKKLNHGYRGHRQRRKQQKGRPHFRPHLWFGKRRRPEKPSGHDPAHGRRRNLRTPVLGIAVLATALLTVPPLASADGPLGGEGWGLGGVEFEIPEPVPGRRLFVEELTVTEDRAAVTLRGAADLVVKARAFGGATGTQLRFFGITGLEDGERHRFDMPLHGPDPSLTFAWRDSQGYAGAVSLKENQLPHPLSSVEGRLCDLEVTALLWKPGSIDESLKSECKTSLKEIVDLQTSRGHVVQRVDARMDAQVIRNFGTVRVTVPVTGSQRQVSLNPGGETRFSVSIPKGEATLQVKMETDTRASVRIALPPVVEQTYHPAWTERLRERVRIWCGDHYRRRWVTFYKYHLAHVRSEMVSRSPLTRTVTETLEMDSSIHSDAPYQLLSFPEPEPTATGQQTPVTEEETGSLGEILNRLRWPW